MHRLFFLMLFTFFTLVEAAPPHGLGARRGKREPLPEVPSKPCAVGLIGLSEPKGGVILDERREPTSNCEIRSGLFVSGVREEEQPFDEICYLDSFDRDTLQEKAAEVFSESSILSRVSSVNPKLILELTQNKEDQEVSLAPSQKLQDCPLMQRKVTRREYRLFLEAVGYPSPPNWKKEADEMAPVVNISYEDAFLYTIWAGMRLPTTQELKEAASDGLLADSEDGLFEWTADLQLTLEDPTSFSQPPLYQILFCPISQVEKALLRDERSSTAGFRCAGIE